MAFTGIARPLVTGLKYRNRRQVAIPLAEVLAARVAASVRSAEVQVVTWAPTSPAHRQRRGVDQAELVARAVADRLGLPCRSLLRRVGQVAQTGRSRAERLTGPSFVGRPLPGRTGVLVVDDVVTTGATLRAAVASLRAAGAATVIAAAVAATP